MMMWTLDADLMEATRAFPSASKSLAHNSRNSQNEMKWMTQSSTKGRKWEKNEIEKEKEKEEKNQSYTLKIFQQFFEFAFLLL